MRFSSAVSAVMVEGTVPVRELEPKSRDFSDIRSPIVLGIMPLMLFDLRFSTVKFPKLPIEDGRDPFREYELKSIERILAYRVVPETLPQVTP